MKVLVCGGRDFNNSMLYETLNKLHRRSSFTMVLHGGARGADQMANSWAEYHRIPIEVYHADWKKHGRAAGHIRNKEMLLKGKPDMVVAFPGGRGTANMITQARSAGVRVIQILPERS